LLLRNQTPQSGPYIHGGVGSTRRIRQWAAARGERVERVVILARRRWPRRSSAHSVQCCVDHDPVEPGRNGRIAAETGGPAECRDHRILECIGSLLWVTKGADRNCPEPVSMPLKERTESVRITVDMATQQLLVSGAAISGLR
jgi:hypothetical protein